MTSRRLRRLQLVSARHFAVSEAGDRQERCRSGEGNQKRHSAEINLIGR
jgi:hypothetical protein